MSLDEEIVQRLSQCNIRMNARSRTDSISRAVNHYKNLLFNFFPDIDPFFSYRNRFMGFGLTQENVQIRTGFRCSNPENIYFLNNVFINYNCTVLAKAPVLFGVGVALGPNVDIYTVNHRLDPALNQFETYASPVYIDDFAWIGGRVVILPGVKIGARSVIGAGSVVTQSTESGWLYCGVPAVKIKRAS